MNELQLQRLSREVKKAPSGSRWTVRSPAEADALEELLEAAGKTASAVRVRSVSRPWFTPPPDSLSDAPTRAIEIVPAEE